MWPGTIEDGNRRSTPGIYLGETVVGMKTGRCSPERNVSLECRYVETYPSISKNLHSNLFSANYIEICSLRI